MPTTPRTHFVEWDAYGRSRVRALCGTWVRRRDHDRVRTPSCPDCLAALRRADELDAAVADRRGDYDGTDDWHAAIANGTARRRGDI